MALKSKKQRTWFAALDAAERPNTKVSKHAVLWIVYSMTKGMSVTHTYVCNTIPLTSANVIGWRHYIRKLFVHELDRAAPTGGHGDVEVDESLYRGEKRKYHWDRMPFGNMPDSGAATAAGADGGGGNRNHGRRIEGPWVFGMLLRRTSELCPFHVQRRDAAILTPLTTRHIAADTTIHSDEWVAYRQLNAVSGIRNIHRTVNHQVCIYSQSCA